jgi:16S rRNA (uracil1498-N3)-methyltransferase
LRLHVDDDLSAGADVALTPGQAHYLGRVMRRAAGAEVLLFNGRDGEWAATVAALGRDGGRASVTSRRRPQAATVGPALLFAPVKKDRVDFLLEKATELGATALQPVTTERTVVERVKRERYRAITVEAAEQCGRLDLPALAEPRALRQALDGWPAGRRLLFCDPLARRRFADLPAAGDDAILVGPEGGFSDAEAAALRALPASVTVSLGPRILRAETAAVAALALWQGRFGGNA